MQAPPLYAMALFLVRLRQSITACDLSFFVFLGDFFHSIRAISLHSGEQYLFRTSHGPSHTSQMLPLYLLGYFLLL
jgi:hypothetical protein